MKCKANEKNQFMRNVARALRFCLLIAWVAGCATLPDESGLLHRYRFFNRRPPQFAGVNGPLSREEGAEIMARLETHYGPSDLLSRHLAFEQAIGRRPLV